MSILLALSLVLFGGTDVPRPAEDDALVTVAIAAAVTILPESTPAYEPRRNRIFIGATFAGEGGIECAIGINWVRGNVEPLSIVCP